MSCFKLMPEDVELLNQISGHNFTAETLRSFDSAQPDNCVTLSKVEEFYPRSLRFCGAFYISVLVTITRLIFNGSNSEFARLIVR